MRQFCFISALLFIVMLFYGVLMSYAHFLL